MDASKNLVSLQYVGDHLENYLGEYARISLSVRDTLIQCDKEMDYRWDNRELLECIIEKNYGLAKSFPFDDSIIGLKMDGLGYIMFKIEADSVVVSFSNDSSTYFDDAVGSNCYHPQEIQTSYDYSTRIATPDLDNPGGGPPCIYLEMEDWYQYLDTWDMDNVYYNDLLFRGEARAVTYGLMVNTPLRNPNITDHAVGFVASIVNMIGFYKFVDDIKIDNAIITIIKAETDYILTSTSEEVNITKSVNGENVNIPAQESDFKPLAEIYSEIKESEDINTDYETQNYISGYGVQALKFDVYGFEIIAIIMIPQTIIFESVIISTTLYFTISVILFLIASCMSCCCGICLTIPLSRVIRKMEKIRKMQLESINIRNPKNLIWEVRSIQTSLQFTVNKLKEYRAFLPSHMQGEGGMEEAILETEDISSENRSSSNSSRKTKKSGDNNNNNNEKTDKSDGLTCEQFTADSVSTNTSNLSNLSSINFMNKKKKTTRRLLLEQGNFGLGYRMKRITIVRFQFPIFRMQEYYAKILSFHKTGMLYEFHFDHIITIIMKNDLRKRYIHQIVDMQQQEEESNKKKAGVCCKVLICTDVGLHGNLGNDRIKKFAVGGDVMKKLHYFLDNMPEFVDFVVCEETQELIKHELVTRNIDDDMFEVSRKKEIGSKEWMYELKEKNEVEKWKMFNEGVNKFKFGLVDDNKDMMEEALKIFNDFKSKNKKDGVVNLWIQKVTDRINQRNRSIDEKEEEIEGEDICTEAKTPRSVEDVNVVVDTSTEKKVEDADDAKENLDPSETDLQLPDDE